MKETTDFTDYTDYFLFFLWRGEIRETIIKNVQKTWIFRMIKLNRGLPFEVKIPNEETLEALEDARLGRNLEEWNSVDTFLESL